MNYEFDNRITGPTATALIDSWDRSILCHNNSVVSRDKHSCPADKRDVQYNTCSFHQFFLFSLIMSPAIPSIPIPLVPLIYIPLISISIISISLISINAHLNKAVRGTDGTAVHIETYVHPTSGSLSAAEATGMSDLWLTDMVIIWLTDCVTIWYPHWQATLIFNHLFIYWI